MDPINSFWRAQVYQPSEKEITNWILTIDSIVNQPEKSAGQNQTNDWLDDFEGSELE